MGDEYFELVGWEKIPVEAMTLSRAAQIYGAVEKNRSFETLGIFQRRDSQKIVAECLVVEAHLHGVAEKNASGILFRERLALLISSDDSMLVDALAMRKTFPRLIHQNGVPEGTPASLCLYNESAAAVLRTWTAERFLARILWWMNKSADGTLHPADQPPEGLFFAANYQLVLPWDFDAKALSHYEIAAGVERDFGGQTLFLIRTADRDIGHYQKVAAIDIRLPAVVSGLVDFQPSTLGQLVDMFAARDVDLIEHLVAAIRTEVDAAGTSGRPIAYDSAVSVLLLNVPIRREKNADPEAILRKAFVVKRGRLTLGAQFGALLIHEKSAYIDRMGKIDRSSAADWRNNDLFGLDILRANTRETARVQSGITENGPDGLILGVGSLGSALLDLWVRSGWGNWAALDSDYIRPHNLSRHGATSVDIGIPKADVASRRASAAMAGANPVKPIVADVLLNHGEAVSIAAETATLIVDVSTTIDYPRLASTISHLPRHASTFLTHDGGSAVLTIEDAGRKTTLLSLEAQYYRALIEEDWGESHLGNQLGKFWSGTGCRDISNVLPYTRILSHAGSLGEQIPLALKNPNSAIKIWTRDHDTGTVTTRELQVYCQISLQRGDFTVYLDQGLIDRLRALRAASGSIETGGVLLGYYDFNIGGIILTLGMKAPPDSMSTETSFIRGKQGVLESVQAALVRTSGIVGYVGEWHCHPPGHTAEPSTTDIVQLGKTAFAMAEEGMPAITLIIGSDDFSLMVGDASE